MLEFGYKENLWQPPTLSEDEIEEIVNNVESHFFSTGQCLIIFKATPYIDSILVKKGKVIGRFTFYSDFIWDSNTEYLFEKECLLNPFCRYTYNLLDEIFDYYSSKHPEWKLKRYNTDSLKMLDHIYNCMKMNTAKEMLYKAELDILAKYFVYRSDINLLSTKPSDLYGGLSNKVLRALNCEEGSKLLATANYYSIIKKIQSAYPDIFRDKLNNAQVAYIRKLIDGHLTVSEIGRLYLTAEQRLSAIWIKSQFDLMLNAMRLEDEKREIVSKLCKIDPIYHDLKDERVFESYWNDGTIEELKQYLVVERNEFDRRVRCSNRKRSKQWQEKLGNYIFRYPQTINDFCREGFYMRNCLLSYVEAFIENETTIIFMRAADDTNKPFITIEIFTDHNGNHRLEQAYHRFNEDCNVREVQIIREFCHRHDIDPSNFHFDKTIDLGGF